MSFEIHSTVDGFCPNCEESSTKEIGTKEETFNIRGDEISITSKVEHCTNCGEFFASTEDEEYNITQAYKAYREKHNLLQPGEIRDIRGKYEIGQRALSKLLGWGEITIHRYESGSLQDNAHNQVLKFISQPENFKEIFDNSRGKLSANLAEKVHKRLERLLNEKSEQRIYSWIESLFNDSREDIFSGYKFFDLERFEIATQYFCRCLDFVSKTKLNKLVWYFDFLSFKENSISATGLVYEHMHYGPTPVHYQSLLDYLESHGNIEVCEIILNEEKNIIGDYFKCTTEPDISIFNVKERECLIRVCEIFSHMNAKQISEFSHTEDAWKNTEFKEIISYEWATSLNVP